mgnify:CR=1 FL=1
MNVPSSASLGKWIQNCLIVLGLLGGFGLFWQEKGARSAQLDNIIDVVKEMKTDVKEMNGKLDSVVRIVDKNSVRIDALERKTP